MRYLISLLLAAALLSCNAERPNPTPEPYKWDLVDTYEYNTYTDSVVLALLKTPPLLIITDSVTDGFTRIGNRVVIGFALYEITWELLRLKIFYVPHVPYESQEQWVFSGTWEDGTPLDIGGESPARRLHYSTYDSIRSFVKQSLNNENNIHHRRSYADTVPDRRLYPLGNTSRTLE
jgi:hypothetical protein